MARGPFKNNSVSNDCDRHHREARALRRHRRGGKREAPPPCPRQRARGTPSLPRERHGATVRRGRAASRGGGRGAPLRAPAGARVRRAGARTKQGVRKAATAVGVVVARTRVHACTWRRVEERGRALENVEETRDANAAEARRRERRHAASRYPVPVFCVAHAVLRRDIETMTTQTLSSWCAFPPLRSIRLIAQILLRYLR